MTTKPRPDKQKVLDEFFTDEMLKAYLTLEPEEGVDRGFHILTKAYRGMTSSAFERFLVFFEEAGYDINSKGADGVSFLESIRPYSSFHEFVQILEAAGAK